MKLSKQTYTLLSLSFLTVIGGLHKYFRGMNRINPFVFYEYYNSCDLKGITPSMFVYELSYMFEFLIVLVIAKSLTLKKAIKNIISPFIGIAMFDIIDYLCFYKRLSFYKLPLLVFFIIIFNIKWVKQQLTSISK